MAKLLEDLPRFYSFTDVYKGDKDDATYAVMRDWLFHHLNKLVELEVRQIVLCQTITPYGELAEVDVHVKLPPYLKRRIVEVLKNFARHAALTYCPEIKEEHGGQWWCVINFHTNPTLTVQVSHRYLKYTLSTEGSRKYIIRG